MAREELVTEVGIEPEKVVFVPNGLAMEEFSPVDETTRRELRERLGWLMTTRIALAIAAFTPCKNHLGLLEALAGLGPVAPPLSVYMAGDGSATLALVNEAISRYGLADGVQVLGRRRDVVDLYRASDFIILNSLYEGTPNAVLEALACGKPVIATDVSDVSKYVRPGLTGWLVPPGDTAALREALRQACTASDETLCAMGSAGRRLLQEMGMDAEHMARRHEEIYIGLVRNGREG
jgi:glycosyltransferase involved in cell wall biosynthesis